MSKTTEPCETINAMRDLYEAGETDPETLLCALDEVLRVNDALTAKVDQYKRDAGRMREALGDISSLHGDAASIAYRALTQQSEVKS